ncbi:MAG: ArgE/DapE family deacylase [Gemmatimonadota bacterium]|uniref:ArgE/DapE family deacylase n=1 Tax=Candidatus Palauibacter scopulicola TaxID=3056741 RepID=UPI00238D357B|nr:ArgE/DapE family deacylase [Candidatus Palauibacter scopulicola]MDE2663084.1 ArgE/DapE family deacylase [Candidatus Palauibacter scopulicola]
MRADGGVLKREERRAAEAVDAGRLFALLADLIAIESVANCETPAQERVAAEMRAIGLETDVWEIDFERLRRHPAYTADVQRHEGLGVVGTMGRGEGRTLILNGHVDVVPAGELERWTHPPFELTKRDGRLFGRGVVDMKGQLCGALAAARALRDADIELDGALQIQSVIGEEDGGAGTLATIERGHSGDGAIVVEPTEFVIAPAQAGALSFRLTVPGLAAHGALREEGVDPVEKFIPIFQRLRALEADRNRDVAEPLFRGEALPYALTMGRLRAGIWPSTVAESLVVEGRYGVAPGEDLARARRALEDAVAEAASGDAWLRDHPPTVEWVGAQFAPARTDARDPVVSTLAGAARAFGGPAPRVGGVRYGADMRLLVNHGQVPTVLFGPGDVREAHRPDESIRAADLVELARILAVTAIRFCRTGAG